MASKKGKSSSANGRDSSPKMLGVKKFDSEKVWPGCIIVRQRGTRYVPGKNVGLGKDHTIFALSEGKVSFDVKNKRSRINVLSSNLDVNTVV